jgi:hypothetical protein
MSASRSAMSWKITCDGAARAPRGSSLSLETGERLFAPHRPRAAVVLHRNGGSHLAVVEVTILPPGPAIAMA